MKYEIDTLRLTSPMMHGSAVVRLQEMLDLLGFDGGPNDGIYGPDTAEQVGFFQARHGLVLDEVCGPVTWAKVIECSNDVHLDKTPFIEMDIRGLHGRPKNFGHKRPWSEINGVTMHQTGCNMPSDPMGWSRLNAHIGITQEGKFIIVNDPTDMIWHAQGLSKHTIGIEIEGNYHGIIGNDSTLWRGGGGPHYLNGKMISALRDAMIWISNQFDLNGAELKYIHAHRQSSNTRRADPGEEIWRMVACPWAAQLRLSRDEFDGGDGFFKGTGHPIPKKWGVVRGGKY